MTREEMENELRNTVGYLESVDKEEFIKGACMGYDRANAAAWQTLSDLRARLDAANTCLAERTDDLNTLAGIIYKDTP